MCYNYDTSMCYFYMCVFNVLLMTNHLHGYLNTLYQLICKYLGHFCKNGQEVCMFLDLNKTYPSLRIFQIALAHALYVFVIFSPPYFS